MTEKNELEMALHTLRKNLIAAYAAKGDAQEVSLANLYKATKKFAAAYEDREYETRHDGD